MLTVLIVEDDEEIRAKALRALASPDIKLASAANGRLGLEQAALLRPDIVICDVDMPEVNGFDVLAALKADEQLASAQVMMLTSLSSRNSIRLGMSLGADDYLTKPFTDAEIIEAVQGLIRRRGRLEVLKGAVVKKAEDSLRGRFAQQIAGEDWSPPESDGPAEQLLPEAAVLFADIRGFTSMAEKLSSQEVASLLAEYFERVCEPVVAHGGQFLKLLGDGLMTVFVPEPGLAAASVRAVRAATEMLALTRGLAAWVTLTFPDARLAPFRVGFGIHCGEVAITQLGVGARKSATPIGDTVNIAARLEGASKELGWDIVASRAVAQQLDDSVTIGATSTITVRGRETPIEVCELRAATDRQRGDMVRRDAAGSVDTVVLHPQALRSRLDGEAITRLRADAREHAGLAARAVKDALGDKLSALRAGALHGPDAPLRLQGFRILRQLGRGGMSSVYLARREEDEELVVLKVLALGDPAGDLRARFMREFSLLSAVRHPNVVRIFNQGFSDDAAYIAMEYFENGDLRSRMTGPMPPREAVRVLLQVVDALAAVHDLGIVHRDLKPENLMVRANADVVLADFGIAKATGGELAAQTTITLLGEMVGSPSYMSPEQIAGAGLTGRSDLYSLGILLYELVMGERPYQGRSVLELLSLHARAALPQLPPHLQALQPVLEGLLAKRPADRFSDAREVAVALRVAARRLEAAAASRDSGQDAS
ncbi:MAG: response regulator [Ramlibacter sp.]|nr:response regulator [Ramlibacter sp.]